MHEDEKINKNVREKDKESSHGEHARRDQILVKEKHEDLRRICECPICADEALKKELGSLVVALAPRICFQNGPPVIPFVAYTDNIVRRVVVEEAFSPVTGLIVVEDVELMEEDDPEDGQDFGSEFGLSLSECHRSRPSIQQLQSPKFQSELSVSHRGPCLLENPKMRTGQQVEFAQECNDFSPLDDSVLLLKQLNSDEAGSGKDVRFVWRRRLRFKRMPNLIQTEVALVCPLVLEIDTSISEGLMAEESRHRCCCARNSNLSEGSLQSYTSKRVLIPPGRGIEAEAMEHEPCCEKKECRNLGVKESQNLRVLHDGNTLDHTHLVHKYLAPIVAGLVLAAPCLQACMGLGQKVRVLAIGVGGGALPIFLHKHFGFHIQGVDADEVVLDLARRHFGLVEDECMKLQVGDGGLFVDRIATQVANMSLIATPLVKAWQNAHDDDSSPDLSGAACLPMHESILPQEAHSRDLIGEVHSISQDGKEKVVGCSNGWGTASDDKVATTGQHFMGEERSGPGVRSIDFSACSKSGATQETHFMFMAGDEVKVSAAAASLGLKQEAEMYRGVRAGTCFSNPDQSTCMEQISVQENSGAPLGHSTESATKGQLVPALLGRNSFIAHLDGSECDLQQSLGRGNTRKNCGFHEQAPGIGQYTPALLVPRSPDLPSGKCDSNEVRGTKAACDPNDPRMHVIIVDVDEGDARLGLSSPPSSFLEPKFLMGARIALHEKGILAMNVVPSGDRPYEGVITALRTVFEEVYETAVAGDVNRVVFALPSQGGGIHLDGPLANIIKRVVGEHLLLQIHKITEECPDALASA